MVEDAPHKAYSGHAAHVTGVRWGADESYAVSIGGRDRTVLQWRLVSKPAATVPRHIVAPWAALDAQGVLWGQKRS